MSDPLNQAQDTIVIGGGISGLAFAHAAQSARDGAEVVLLEGSDRVGGLVHTVDVDGPVALRYEDGPEALTTSPEVRALAGELGLALDDAPATKRFLVHRREVVAVPTAPPALLGSKLLSTRGKLRLLSEPWRRREPGLDGSIADFVRHRIGAEALEALVDPLVSGIHAGDPEQLSVRACFPALVRMVDEHGSLFAAMRAKRKAGGGGPRPGLAKPRGGMRGLSDALAEKLGGRIRRGVAVNALRPVSHGPDGGSDGWTVETSAGAMEARRVVLALPLRPARGLLETAAPEAARALAGMQAESLASVLVAYRREAVAHPLDGFGYLVPRREGLRHLGVLFSSSIDPACCADGHVLLRVLLGGARRPELVEANDEALGRLVRDEVRPLLGIEGEPVWSCVERYRGVLPRFGLDHPANLERFEAALPPGLTVLGNFTRGIGLASLIEEARRAARERRPAPRPPEPVGA